MVVNSLNFLLFFVVVFVVYYLPISRKSHKFQNTWLFLASYFFYGFADWKMIPLLLGATIMFYGIGLWLKSEMEKGHVKYASNITTLGVVLGIGVLLYFKYLNFFADSFAQLLKAIGLNVSWSTLNIVLPIGVSFFTFKLISYVIEVHREHIQPSKDFIEFGTYIAFFPTILSGPIDRPNKFLLQLKERKDFNYPLAVDGCRQILWGMFTKMCIADNLEVVTSQVWNNTSAYGSLTLIIVALLYFIQMYADFDGYSNMAIGVGKLLGFDIARNFNHPLIARNTAEYWRRWHMSLTSWITDYVFMPLNIAFRSIGNYGVILAVMINLIVIGLWHGANWTFGLFGLYHGLLFIPLVFSGAFGKNKKIKPTENGLPKLNDLLKMLGTFCLVAFGLIIFRAPSLVDFAEYIQGLTFLKYSPSIWTLLSQARSVTYFFIVILLITDWVKRKEEHPLQFRNNWLNAHCLPRYAIYYVIILAIIVFQGGNSSFIYFQF